MALFKKAETEEEVPPLLEREGRALRQAGLEAYRWLGSRYLWYRKIRTAKPNALPFMGKNLEEKMQATRSALRMLERTVNAGLVVAYKSTRDAVGKISDPPPGLPAAVEMPDRNNPPRLNDENDALIISFMPLRFLNLTKMARDKGKGIDFYTDGLIKKLVFKVLAFYADSNNWQTDRLAFFFRDFPEEVQQSDINAKLAPLKTELDLFAASYQMFKFGTPPRRKEAGTANTLDEVFDVPVQELLMDLYFQSVIHTGMANFIFRYYLTLLAGMPHPQGMRLISNIFQPALAKVDQVRIRFQSSFAMERAKISVRPQYFDFYKKMETQPFVTEVKRKGKTFKQHNYTHRVMDLSSFQRAGNFNERQAAHWRKFLTEQVLTGQDPQRKFQILTEILSTLLRSTQFAVDGKLEVVKDLRKFSEEQITLSQKEVRNKKKVMEDAKRTKLATARKFKSDKQFDIVATIEQEAADIEAKGTKLINAMETAMEKRKELLLQRTESMEAAAHDEAGLHLGRAGAAIFSLAEQAAHQDDFRQAFVQHVIALVQQDNDLVYLEFYKNLFSLVPNLSPTEKMLLREAVSSRTDLKADEMPVSDEEAQAFDQQVMSMKTDLNTEAPGTLEKRFRHNTVNTTVDKMLEAGLTQGSLALALKLPVNAPNKPGEKIPPQVVKKLLVLNQLMHPFAEHDITLPNVDASQPPEKHINFNRLQKLLP
ncbi:MAG: hypothetical protein O7G32_11295 [SAR324 cluster bacterium]|nr:hypothetical protein [SAR324 cluster bacterium]